jgi:ankyrin repeat protein
MAHGASLRATTVEGDTPLHLAVAAGRGACVSALLSLAPVRAE